MEPLQECFLSDVRVSKEVRHFGGVVNESDNFTFYRFFGILLNPEALEPLEELGWPVRNKRTTETRKGDFPGFLQILIDYDIIAPTITVILNEKIIPLDERTIGSLDAMDIDRADIEIEPVGHYDDNGIFDGTAAYLKSMQVFVRSTYDGV